MLDLHISELNYSTEEISDIVGLMPNEINIELLNKNNSISIKPHKLILSI